MRLRCYPLALLPVFAAGCSSGLHDAARRGDIERIETLLDDGLAIDSVDDENKTPLAMAALHHQTDATLYLISRNARVDAIDNKGRTPLHSAAYCGDLVAAKALIDAGADLEASNQYYETPLSTAVRKSRKELALYLIGIGASVAPPHGDGFHLLTLAVEVGDADVVQAMLDAGAPIDAAERSTGNTPLHQAASLGNARMTQLLVDAGASISLQNSRGETAESLARSLGLEATADIIRREKISGD